MNTERFNHDSISEIRAALDLRSIALKKRFGQNFLVRADVRERIAALVSDEVVRTGESDPADVWEIGPGLGALTDALVHLGLRPVLFEIDRGLIAHLRDRYGDDLEIVEGDAVRTVRAREGAGRPPVIAGNLPYQSAAPILASLVARAIPPVAMVLLVQLEMAQRMVAAPRENDYSAFTVMIRSRYEVRRLFTVGPGAFYPRPRVDSAVVRLVSRSEPVPARCAPELESLVRRAFAQRRKTLRNTIPEYQSRMEVLGIDPGARPEELDIDDFRALACQEMG